MNLVTKDELLDLLADPPAGYLFIDVRERAEFAEFSIGGWNLPPHEVGDHLEQIKKFTHIIVFCSNGMRSGLVIRWLSKKNPDATYGHLEEGIW